MSHALAAGAALATLGASAFGAPALAAGATSTTSPTAAHPATTAIRAGAGGQAAAALGATQPVLVLLRDQHPAVPATPASAGHRAAVLAGDQRPVAAALARAGATHVRTFRLINAVAATVSTAEAARLARDPAVAEVIPDATIRLSDPAAAQRAARTAAATAGATPAPGVCAAPGKVQLNPEALQVTHTASDTRGALTARSLGATGAGVKVAYIAEGIDTNNPDFIRADGSHVFVDYQDFNGEGTAAPTTAGEAFLDASSIAAQGRHVYDVSHFSALPLNRPCLIRIEGVAPGASLVGLKVFGNDNLALTSQFLQAIDYAVSVDHVDVLNESFGSNPFPDRSNDAIKLFDEEAVAAGTTVVASSGDAGVTNTIGSPASDPKVISTGASTTFRINLQTGYAFARQSGARGWIDDNISSLSSAGFTESGRTVDLVAPGELNWVLCTPRPAQYTDCTDYTNAPAAVGASGGTSESAPLTAGAAALVIQAFRATHHGVRPTPAQVKTILTGTADDIAAPAEQQGAGLLDTYKAVLAARSFATATARPTRVGANLLTSTNQFTVVTRPGTVVRRRVGVTNTGANAQTVQLSTRSLGAYRSVLSTRTLLSDRTSRHALDFQGHVDNVQVVHFDVPAGSARLDASIAYVGTTLAASSRVRLTLLDPAARFAGYSLPQGVGNYGDSQVANPRPGRWTAFITSRNTAAGGTTGPVVFGARVARFVPLGSITPSTLRLRPGQSAAFTYTARTPMTPGDASSSLVLQASSNRVHKTTSVAAVLRSVATVIRAPLTFTGTLTGGNGRSTFGGVTGYYQLAVPAGLAELNTSIVLPVKSNPFDAYLVSPTGQAVAFAGSQQIASDTQGHLVAVDTRGAQLHVLRPAAGRWDLVINFAPTVSGTALSQTYRVRVDGTAVPVGAGTLPTKATSTLRRGRPVAVHITVHNTGTTPEAFFLDPRKNVDATYRLAVTPAKVALPLTTADAEPSFTMPTNSSAVAAVVTASGPVAFDMGADFGSPDVASVSRGRTATARTSGRPLTAGGWFVAPNEVGPYGAGPAPAETAVVQAAVRTRAFDPTVTSATGDLWLSAIDPNATAVPVVVSPGATQTLTVVITPTGKVGSRVAGTLYVDDANLLNVGLLVPNGNQVASLPYRYTIKR